MLERATTCLEAGGRHLLRTTTTSCLRNQHQRALHTAFWHHGASELSLPVWWGSVAAPDAATGDEGGLAKSCAIEANSSDGQLLDFLYPQKALALIQRITRHGNEALEAGRRYGTAVAGVRHFSTAPRMGQTEGPFTVEEAEAEVEAPKMDAEEKDASAEEEALREEQRIQAEVEERLLANQSPSDALWELFRSGEQRDDEVAWRLFDAIPDFERDEDIKTALLEYLQQKPSRERGNDIIQIFEALSPDARRPSAYRAAISAYLAKDLVEVAVHLYEIAASRTSDLGIGTDLVLGAAVHANDWELAMRVLTAFAPLAKLNKIDMKKLYWEDARRRTRASDLIWGEVAKLPYLRGHLQSLFIYVHHNKDELMPRGHRSLAPQLNPILSNLLFGVIAETTDYILATEKPGTDVVFQFFIDLIHELNRKGLTDRFLYDYLIQRLIHHPMSREYVNWGKPHLELYKIYRDDCVAQLNKGKKVFCPSRELLRLLTLKHGHFHSEKGVENIMADYRLFYPGQFIPFRTLRFVIDFYAELGRAPEVEEYFDELKRAGYMRLPADLPILTALPYVYARRADPEGAEKQFKRIIEEFGVTPDVACWNVLLLAYVRADDLDGALACFNRMVAAEIDPDMHTFNTLLTLCAHRGDVEAYEVLYARAEHLDLDGRSDKYARAGFVEVLLNFDDVEGAEATALTMLKHRSEGILKDSLTHTWNLLIQHYATKGDIEKCRFYYRQMKANKIPVDSWTYGGLMRALVESKQTNAAYKILRKTMPQNNVRIHAFHYALVIIGFLKERQLHLALKANKRMVEHNVPQTVSSRIASLSAIGLAEKQMLRERGDKSKSTRLEATERKLRDIMLEGWDADEARRQPQHRALIDSRNSAPESYIAQLIMLYGTRGALGICKELFEAAAIAREDEPNYQTPITLLVALMNTHLLARRHDEVAKCWHLARAQADKVVKTVKQLAMRKDEPDLDALPLTDPSLRNQQAEAPISRNRRQALVHPFRIYLRSLIRQNTDEALDEATRTIKSLMISGYVLDSVAWNDYIRALANAGRIYDAFAACETFLMPHFPGWRDLNPLIIRKNVRGQEWMNVRPSDPRTENLRPRYQTLVVLARVYAQIRQDDANNIGYNEERGAWPKEILEEEYPMSIRAVESMPRTDDWQQRKHLSMFV